MFFDVHAHVYPEKIAHKAKESIESFYHYPVQMDGRVETLLAEGEKAGIVRHVIHSVAVSWERVTAIHRFIADTVKAHPDRFFGFGTLVPDHPDMEGALQEMVSLGFLGVKLHPDIQRFHINGSRSMEMLRRIAAKNLPVLLHVGDQRYDYSHPERVAFVLDRIPNLKIICAHLGGWTMWREGWRYLAGRDNVYTDCSSSLSALQPEEAVRIIHHYGVEHVVFGTDFPMWSPMEEVLRFMQLPLTEAEQHRIAHENLTQLLQVSL